MPSEQKAATDPARPQASSSRYECPACHRHFGRAPLRPWPKNVPWYKPQGMHAACPHCGTALRSKYSTRTTRVLMIASWIDILLVKPVASHAPWPQLSLACLVVAFVAIPWLAVIAWREWRDPQRFVRAQDG